MKLILRRIEFTPNSTIGLLFIDDVFECYTLEDTIRNKKVYGETAIPAGKYEVETTLSARFKKLLPLIKNVPNFSGVRIHPGNTAADTEGCILLGQSKGIDYIGNSRKAFEAFFTKFQQKGGKGTLEIRDIRTE